MKILRQVALLGIVGLQANETQLVKMFEENSGPMSCRGQDINIAYRYLPNDSEISFSSQEMRDYYGSDIHPEHYFSSNFDTSSPRKEFRGDKSLKYLISQEKIQIFNDYEKSWPCRNRISGFFQNLELGKRIYFYNQFLVGPIIWEANRLPNVSERPFVTLDGGIQGCQLENPIVEPNISFLGTPKFTAYLLGSRALLRAQYRDVQVDLLGAKRADMSICLENNHAGIIKGDGTWQEMSEQEYFRGFQKEEVNS